MQQQIQRSIDEANRDLFTRDSVQQMKKASPKYRPLCLRRVINELQQGLTSTQKVPVRTRENITSNSRDLWNFSDLQVTEIALQKATAYQQSSLLLKRRSQQASSSLERILKEKINRSRKKWRQGTEPGQYHRMWRSLGRDLQDSQQLNKKGDKALESSNAHRNGNGKKEFTSDHQKETSNERLSFLSSKQDKHSTPGSRYRSPRQVLPRIVLPLL